MLISWAVLPIQAAPLKKSEWGDTGEMAKSLCGYVDNEIPTASGTLTRFRYQEVVFHQSGVRLSDSIEVRKQKIQREWVDSLQNLNCSSPGFSVMNGSLTKFAILKNFDSFIVDIACNWQVDLNHIDEVDGRSALDYVRDERELASASGSPTANKLGSYYKIMRKSGARHARELRSGMPRPTPGPCK